MLAHTFRARNFRVLEPLEWSPSGLCLLCGPNGSGKSTTLDVLLFLRTLFERGLESALSAVQGQYFRSLDAPEDEPRRPHDRGALLRGRSAAGVPDDPPEGLLCRGDPEDFRTTDAAYLADDESACPCWSELPSGRAKKKQRPKWFGSARERHPKGYLQWLCRDGAAKNCTRYDETHHGSRALTEIDWQALLGRPHDHFLYLRSLVADIADALNQPPAAGSIHDPQASATSRFASGVSRGLRNL